MKLKILLLIISFFIFTPTVFANHHICSDPSFTDANGNTVPGAVLKACNLNENCEKTTPPRCVPIPPQGALQSIFGRINPPQAIINLGPGATGINNVLNNIITLIYVVASIIFVFMIIISALQWIMSGGDKEAYTNARKRLTWAIIGITVLALSFVIATVIGQITGFSFFRGQPPGGIN